MMGNKVESFFNQFTQDPKTSIIGISLVLCTWVIALGIVTGMVFYSQERTGQALVSSQSQNLPAIVLEPADGPAGSFVTIWGEDWPVDDTVLIYVLADGETDIPKFAIASATTDAEGRFVTGFTLPAGPLWENQEQLTFVARSGDNDPVAQAIFKITPVEEGQSTEISPTAVVELPSAVTSVDPLPTSDQTATGLIGPGGISGSGAVPATTEAQTPPDNPQPAQPTVTATTNLNIRSGPGLDYPIIGLLPVGQSAEAIGISADRGWWLISVSGIADGVGWVSAYYVTPQNTNEIATVQAPRLPAPVSITDSWRGEYYPTVNLSGPPALVRNDAAIDFNWGAGSPVSQLPINDYSVRWTRTQTFEEGLYRFHVIVDDGARLYVDEGLVIDDWREGAWRQISGERWLSSGNHNLRLEYYEHTGDSYIQLWWEKVDPVAQNYPDWKGEYWPNRNLSGAPALVRNDTTIDFNWGGGSPGPGLPGDNFSARWTRDWYTNEGRYRLRVMSDDGIRLWVDNHLLIDRWWDGAFDETVEHWLGAGTHQVRLEYYENVGEARVRFWVEWISGPSDSSDDDEPEADFDADRRSGTAPLRVKFDNDSDGDYDDCKWYFGDGDTSRACDDPTHTYHEPGEYTVKL
ncbi:MAG: PA14 domain-containing protein, partial [Planctomycetota bacterium]